MWLLRVWIILCLFNGWWILLFERGFLWYIDLPKLQSIKLHAAAFRGDKYLPEESNSYYYYYCDDDDDDDDDEEKKKAKSEEAIKENSLIMKSMKRMEEMECWIGYFCYYDYGLDLPCLSSFSGCKNNFAFIGKVVLEGIRWNWCEWRW